MLVELHKSVELRVICWLLKLKNCFFKENEQFRRLSSLLPVSIEIAEHLDKASIIRLAKTTIRLNNAISQWKIIGCYGGGPIVESNVINVSFLKRTERASIFSWLTAFCAFLLRISNSSMWAKQSANIWACHRYVLIKPNVVILNLGWTLR